jgi:hypothetical protein
MWGRNLMVSESITALTLGEKTFFFKNASKNLMDLTVALLRLISWFDLFTAPSPLQAVQLANH